MTDVLIADTSGLLATYNPQNPEHKAAHTVLESCGHLVISPMVLAELDYLITNRAGAVAAINALGHITSMCATGRYEVPETGAHLGTAHRVMRAYRDADAGQGIGLTDAMNVTLAAEFRTDAHLTLDHRHFRMIRPLTRHSAFRLLPADRGPEGDGSI